MLVDTNVLVRVLIGAPESQALAATRLVERVDRLLLPDLVFAEVVYVLGSVYGLSRQTIAWMMRSVLGYESIVVSNADLLTRSLEIYEQCRIDFADAYLAASAETTGVGMVASFDRALDRVGTIERVEPVAA